MSATKPLSIRQKTAGLILLLCVLGSSAAAQSQQTEARHIGYEVRPEYLGAFKNALSNYVSQAILDENNIMAEAHHEQDKPSVLWLIERWTDKAALEKFVQHPQSKALNELAKKALVTPAKVIRVKDLHPISKEQWRQSANANEAQLTIMLFVDAKPGTQQNFKDTYSVAMPKFRSEPGVVTYQMSEFSEDGGQFVTYEKFRNEAAFQYHLNFPPIVPVIDYLNTSIKNPPFQDSVHRLIEFAPSTNKISNR
jgi:quinol monooxygenase YgiN